ncbi:hypothetical protein BU15DRAFT_67494 [Melanogaster broomeanus]|nr:hypothetical protein BU15DRAFT_67494 [Melanogaster broomeanus]
MAETAPTNSPVDIPLFLADPAILPMSTIAGHPNTPGRVLTCPMAGDTPYQVPGAYPTILSKLVWPAMALIGKMAGSARDSGISTGELVGAVSSHRACGDMSPWAYRWRDESPGLPALFGPSQAGPNCGPMRAQGLASGVNGPEPRLSDFAEVL